MSGIMSSIPRPLGVNGGCQQGVALDG
jgi:hypothetical protein